MSDVPPPVPLDYRPPEPGGGNAWLQFIGGVLAGCGLTFFWIAGSVLFLLGTYGEDRQPPMVASAVPFAGPVVLIAVGVLLARRPRPRPFGLGLVASVPLFVLTAFVICGGLR